MDEQLVTVLVGVGVVALIGLVVFLRWRLTPSKEQKKKAMDFLKGLEEALYARILEIIKTFNIDDYKDLASLEIDLLSKIKEVAKAYILDELNLYVPRPAIDPVIRLSIVVIPHFFK